MLPNMKKVFLFEKPLHNYRLAIKILICTLRHQAIFLILRLKKFYKLLMLQAVQNYARLNCFSKGLGMFCFVLLLRNLLKL